MGQGKNWVGWNAETIATLTRLAPTASLKELRVAVGAPTNNVILGALGRYNLKHLRKGRDKAWAAKRVFSDAEKAVIKRMFVAGDPLRVIAKAVHADRHRVADQVRALGLSRPLRRNRTPKPRGQTFGRSTKAKLRLVPTARRPPASQPAPEPSSDPIGLMDLKPHHCRWPVASGAPWLHCGARKTPGSSYCEHHMRRSLRSDSADLPTPATRPSVANPLRR